MQFPISTSLTITPVIADNEMLKTFGLVDADGMIELDTLVSTCKSTANRHGKLSFELPMLGKFALSESDFDEISEFILKAAGK